VLIPQVGREGMLHLETSSADGPELVDELGQHV
jgi:hypothetical protein